MAFIKGTNIYTNNGWKPIEDIAGYDKVLVRNFLGDAEFVQPFAIKKKKYKGEIVRIQGYKWAFNVTPDHIVVYDNDYQARGNNFVQEKAKDIKASKNVRIYRKFRYMHSNEYRKEIIKIYKDQKTYYQTIDTEDWFTLVGYVLCRGYIRKASTYKKTLAIKIDKNRSDEEVQIIGGILNRIGLDWNLTDFNEKTNLITISVKNTLTGKMIYRLGSYKRKEMKIPDAMIYNCNKELSTKLIDTIIDASKRSKDTNINPYRLTTTNDNLIASLEKLGILWGYNMCKTLAIKKGESKGLNKVTKDVYSLIIAKPRDTFSPTKITNTNYDGYVYEIDLFEGEVYTLEGSSPIWVSPK